MPSTLAARLTADPTAAHSCAQHHTPVCSRTEAKELAAWGAELVQADAANLDQLNAAFKGAHGVYGMTFAAWAIEDPQEATAYEYNLGARLPISLYCKLHERNDRF